MDLREMFRVISVDLCDRLTYCVRIGYNPYGITQ